MVRYRQAQRKVEVRKNERQRTNIGTSFSGGGALLEALRQSVALSEGMDLSTLPYKHVLTIECLLSRLQLLFSVNETRSKSEVLRSQDFAFLVELDSTNFSQLVNIKKEVKGKKGIYVLSFSNDKVYVGQTNDLCRRLDEYWDINNHTYKGHNGDIRELYNLNPNIRCRILFKEAAQDFNQLEKFYIEQFNADDPRYGYNKTGGNV